MRDPPCPVVKSMARWRARFSSPYVHAPIPTRPHPNRLHLDAVEPRHKPILPNLPNGDGSHSLRGFSTRDKLKDLSPHG